MMMNTSRRVEVSTALTPNLVSSIISNIKLMAMAPLYCQNEDYE